MPRRSSISDRRRAPTGPGKRARWRGLARSLALGWLLAGPCAGQPVQAQARADAASESDVEAAFLYNFAKFVEWPAAAFARPEAPLLLCIVGPDPFGAAIDAIDGKPVGSHMLQVARLGGPATDRLGQCHIAFVAGPDSTERRRIVKSLAGKPILSVGDAADFTNHGGIINFVVADGRVQFAIAPSAATAAGLVLRAYLLKLAIIVEGKE